MPKNEVKYDYDRLPGLVLWWHFPGEWWRRRHWLSKMVFISVWIAFIAAVSIAIYDAAGVREVLRLNDIQRQQIGELNKVIESVKSERMSADEEREDKVLNEISDIQRELNVMREQSSALSNDEFEASVQEALKALEASPSAY